MADNPVFSPCSDPETLAELVRGTLAPSARAAAEAHAADCDLCAHWLAELTRIAPEAAGDSSAPIRLRGFGPRPIAAAAAAACLVAGAGWWILSPGKPGADRQPLQAPAWEPAQRAIRTGAGRTEARTLPDGSRVRIGENTALRLLDTAPGERAHLLLEEGTLEVEASKASGRLRVSAASGTVEVLGTRFTARAFVLDGTGVVENFPGGPVLHVEIHEGKIALGNARGSVTLAAGMRGIAFADEPPAAQEQSGTSQDARERFLQILEPAGNGWKVRPGQENLCRLLAAMAWGSGTEMPPLLWRLRKTPEPGEER